MGYDRLIEEASAIPINLLILKGSRPSISVMTFVERLPVYLR